MSITGQHDPKMCRCADCADQVRLAKYLDAPGSATKDSIKHRLNAQWQSRKMSMDWLGLETIQRDIFAALAGGEFDQQEALCYLAESIEAFTRRGPVASF